MSEERLLPDEIVNYLKNIELAPKQRKAEIDAYWKIQALIDSTSDAFAKRVHMQTLEYVVDDGHMKLTYWSRSSRQPSRIRGRRGRSSSRSPSLPRLNVSWPGPRTRATWRLPPLASAH